MFSSVNIQRTTNTPCVYTNITENSAVSQGGNKDKRWKWGLSTQNKGANVALSDGSSTAGDEGELWSDADRSKCQLEALLWNPPFVPVISSHATPSLPQHVATHQVYTPGRPSARRSQQSCECHVWYRIDYIAKKHPNRWPRLLKAEECDSANAIKVSACGCVQSVGLFHRLCVGKNNRRLKH